MDNDKVGLRDPKGATARARAAKEESTVEVMGINEIDPAVGTSSSPWRSWAENASPDLLGFFNESCLPLMKEVRARYPANVAPNSGDYRNMRNECITALNRLAEQIEAEHDYES